jgi:hypothetical protein
MKLATRILSLLILAAFATFYMSCDGGGGDDQSEQQIQFNKLKGTWNVTEVTDGTGERGDFAGVQLSLGASSNFAENGTYPYEMTGTLPNPSPWPKQGGLWEFGSDPSSDLIRDPGGVNELEMTYDVSDTQLEITFFVSGDGWQGGRTQSVEGQWTFIFTKAQ